MCTLCSYLLLTALLGSMKSSTAISEGRNSKIFTHCQFDLEPHPLQSAQAPVVTHLLEHGEPSWVVINTREELTFLNWACSLG